MAKQVTKAGARGTKKKSASRAKFATPGARQAKKAKESPRRTIAVHHQKVMPKKTVAVDLGPKKFTQEELEGFKKIILEKRRETVEELDTLKESMMDVTTGEYVSESSTYSLHMEQGTDAMEREKTFLFASRGSKFVNQLDDALARIEAGTYGVCRVCNLLIPKERLEAVPTAQTCAEYKNTNTPCERGRVALAKKR
jgi:RNA polymerase-binding transcription factor DksA